MPQGETKKLGVLNVFRYDSEVFRGDEMGVIALMCSVVDSPLADIPVTETPTITDGIETTVNSVSGITADFTDKFLSMDFINEILTQYAKVFAMGFALATLLILLTYGVFKAFSLVRIE